MLEQNTFSEAKMSVKQRLEIEAEGFVTLEGEPADNGAFYDMRDDQQQSVVQDALGMFTTGGALFSCNPPHGKRVRIRLVIEEVEGVEPQRF